VIKSPEIRSAELLDCAQRLFFERGYDTTTVNDILREAGLSKGAFYHYFLSKEALLEALAARLARESLAELQPILDDRSLDAVGRLNAFFAGSRRMKVEMAPQMRRTFDVIFRPENVVLFHRIDRAVSEIALPLIAKILAEGNAEGSFSVPDPEAFADFLLQARLDVARQMNRAIEQVKTGAIEKAADHLETRLANYGIAIDRLLKLPDGTIRMVEPGFARALLDAG
jgi:AcrR family transcriptional regulator